MVLPQSARETQVTVRMPGYDVDLARPRLLISQCPSNSSPEGRVRLVYVRSILYYSLGNLHSSKQPEILEQLEVATEVCRSLVQTRSYAELQVRLENL